MTDLKIDSKPNSGAAQALEGHVRRLYDKPGLSVVAIVELRHDLRVEVASGSEKSPSVTVKIVGCEVASPEQEGALREAQRALYLMRTARGTLDEEGTLQLDEDTLRRTGGLLHAIETARLRAGMAHWANYARQVVSGSSKMSATEMAHEIEAIADGMGTVLDTAEPMPGDNDE